MEKILKRSAGTFHQAETGRNWEECPQIHFHYQLLAFNVYTL